MTRYPIKETAARRPVFRRLGGPATALALIALPLAATEIRHSERVNVKRPVVVVHGDGHVPIHTWSSVGARPFLGVRTVDLTPELRLHFGVPEDAGVLISKIVPDSPAAEDLRVGDILTAVDGEPIESPAGLVGAIAKRQPGETVLLEIWRDGSVQSIESVLAEREGEWVDIRQFQLPDLEARGLLDWTQGDLEQAIQIESETLEKALERLNEQMSSPEWRERIRRFQQHQGDLMERIEELELRLHELESELESLPRRK